MESFGIQPYWSLPTWSSAIFESVGVKGIGLKSFPKSSICVDLGTGKMLAHFHLEGRASSSKDEFMIEHMGLAIK